MHSSVQLESSADVTAKYAEISRLYEEMRSMQVDYHADIQCFFECTILRGKYRLVFNFMASLISVCTYCYLAQVMTV